MHIAPLWSLLDSVLMAPFRLPSIPEFGLWLGCSVLALYCIFIGKIISACLKVSHASFYDDTKKSAQHYHTLSMKALHTGEKAAYFATNTLAHEYFGKNFFVGIGINMAFLLPVPFALAWLALRFEGIVVYTLPYIQIHLNYVFIFLTSYILIALCAAFLQNLYKKSFYAARRKK